MAAFPMFLAAIFRVEIEKKQKTQLTVCHSRMDKEDVVCIIIMKYYSAKMKEKILQFLTTWSCIVRTLMRCFSRKDKYLYDITYMGEWAEFDS